MEKFALLSNIAGNSYNFFHYGPWCIATLASWGRFCLGPARPQGANDNGQEQRAASGSSGGSSGLGSGVSPRLIGILNDDSECSDSS